MEVHVRPLNKGEVFPCSVKSAKELFKGTEVNLNFAYTSRVYGTFLNTPDMFYLKNNIRGIVLSSMYMSAGYVQPTISFFVIKSSSYNLTLKKEFETSFLPQYLQLYKSMIDEKVQNSETTVMLVELVNDNLKVHKFKFR